jgi:catalase
MADLWTEIVDALHELNGVHPGYRAAHARGVFCAGSFKATDEAGRLSRAAHLSGESVPVTARFSNGSGNPHLPDNDRTDGRGMAVKFEPPDSEPTDIVAISIPVFFVRTPEDFLEFTRARVPNPETGELDGAKIGAYLGSHPETAAALERILPALGPPRSFATCAYNGLHAFALLDGEGQRTWVRYRWEPEAGEAKLPEEEFATVADDFLMAELRDRLGSGSVVFTLRAQIAEDGDTLDDPTVGWPPERRWVDLGRLELMETVIPESPGSPVVFDPNRLIDGVEASADKILAARSPAYSVSIERRAAECRS